MSLSTQNAPLAKRRAANWISAFGGPFSQGALKWFWSYIAQFKGSPAMQVVEFEALSNTDQVLANAACTLYLIVLRKTTATATWSKFTDNATTGATNGSQEISIKGATIGETVLVYPQPLAMANGLTARGNTTATGNTTSGANGASGFVVIGAAA